MAEKEKAPVPVLPMPALPVTKRILLEQAIQLLNEAATTLIFEEAEAYLSSALGMIEEYGDLRKKEERRRLKAEAIANGELVDEEEEEEEEPRKKKKKKKVEVEEEEDE